MSEGVAARLRPPPFLLIGLIDFPMPQKDWAAEVERRQTEIENGTVSLLPGPETLTMLKAEFE